MKCQPKLLVFLIMMWSLILASWPLVAGVDYEITYDDLKSFNFDPHAEILFALALTNKLKNNSD